MSAQVHTEHVEINRPTEYHGMQGLAVETSIIRTPTSWPYVSIAKVSLQRVIEDGIDYATQHVTSQVLGLDRYGALHALELTLKAMLNAVTEARASAAGRGYNPKCMCHTCCLLSCCNPTIAPAMTLVGSDR